MASQRKLAGVIVYVLKLTPSGNRVLFLKRSGGLHEGGWWPVAGTPKPGETGLDTALRELYEETGLEPLKVLDFGMEIPHVDADSRLETFVVLVDADAEVRLNYEHSDFQWLDGEQAIDSVPEHSKVYLTHLKERFVDAGNLA